MIMKNLALRVPALSRLHRSRNTLLDERDTLAVELRQASARLGEALATLNEARKFADSLKASIASPFHHFHATFDAEEVVRRHAVQGLRPDARHLTNFLGVLIHPSFFPQILADRAGQVEPVPIPANWHADMAEWAAALRAVDLARDSFTVLELGCGWGCWMNNTGAAARRRGLAVRLLGVEGDRGHIGFAEEACATNGFAPSQVTLRHGIATAGSGVALFPRQSESSGSWALAPVFGATEAQRRQAAEAGTHDELPMVALEELLAPHPRIDLLHMDIQGGETEILRQCGPLLAEKVAYLVVGTHSRQIEGQIFEMLLAAGWKLEMERPAILRLEEQGPFVTVDGVQGWRNLALNP